MKALTAILFFIALQGVCLYANAQSIKQSVASPYLYLNAYSTYQKDAFSFSGNQAALASIKDISAGIFAERRFMLAENNYYFLTIAIPTQKLGSIGASFAYSGFKNFAENNIGLAYSKTLGKAVDVGVQFNYYGYKVPGYGNANAVYFEGGAIVHPLSKLNLGLHLSNPVGGKLSGSSDEKINARYKLGIGYDPSENLYTAVEIIKEENFPVSINGGVQYQFKKQFMARVGFISATSSGFASAGVVFKNIRLDVGTGWHQQLGFSPTIALHYHFKQKEK